MQTPTFFFPRPLLFKVTLLVAIINLILVLSARAACPHPTPAPNSEFFKASSVIVATVLSEEADANPSSTSLIEGWFYRLRIERIFRGPRQKLLTVYTENTNGRFPLRVGERYLLFVYLEEGRLTINGCGNSALLTEAGGAVSAIEAIKNAGPFGEIEGRVQIGLGGEGVPGIRIVARTKKLRFSTVTGKDGWFQMKVPPGTYQLVATSRRFSIELSDATLWYDEPEHFEVHKGSTSHFEYLASPK